MDRTNVNASKQKKNLAIVVVTALALAMTVASVTMMLQAQGAAAPAAKKTPGVTILKFKVPKPTQFVPAGQAIIIKGVSMEPNATLTSCVVGLGTNSHEYGPTQGTGPSPARAFVNWTGQTEPLKPGLNQISAELICMKAGVGNVIVKHVTHNVTATNLGTTATSSLPTVVVKPAAPSKAPAAPPPAAQGRPILTPP